MAHQPRPPPPAGRSAGNLYGSTIGSGAHTGNCSNPVYDGGTIFEIANSAGSYGSLQAIYSFTTTGGNYAGSDSVLLANPNGQLVGTLQGGGRGYTGSVFGVTGVTVTAAAMGTVGDQVPAPEPATPPVFGFGLVGLRVMRRRRGWARLADGNWPVVPDSAGAPPHQPLRSRHGT